MRTVPLWSVALLLRETVDPGSLGAEVMHYSIPTLEATGGPQVEAADSIKSQKLRIHGGELLVSKLNPRKARVLIVPPVAQATVASTEFVAFRPFGADPQFLAYVMLSESTRQSLDANVRSVTRSHQRVEPEVIARTPVPDIPLDDQRRIADFLDTETARLDALLRNRAEQASRTLERAQAVLDLTMEDLARKYGSRPLRRELQRVQQGSSPQCDGRPAALDERGVLKLSAINRGQYLEHENKALPEGVLGDARHEVRPGDLLMSRANTPDRVGDVAVVQATRSGLLLPDLIYRLKLREAGSVEFVAAALRSSRIRGLVSVTARGTSQSMVKLRGEDIAGLPIPAAPPADRRDAVRRVEAATDAARHLEERIATGARLIAERRQALITGAVTGQFDVTTARRGVM